MWLWHRVNMAVLWQKNGFIERLNGVVVRCLFQAVANAAHGFDCGGGIDLL